MSDSSQSPIRRAEGYCVAKVAWGKEDKIDADADYNFVRKYSPHNIKPKTLESGIRLNKPLPRGKARLQFLIDNLKGRNAYYCRGYLFALVEDKLISVDTADSVMMSLSYRPISGEFLQATYPGWQTHPLNPYGEKIDATNPGAMQGILVEHRVEYRKQLKLQQAAAKAEREELSRLTRERIKKTYGDS